MKKVIFGRFFALAIVTTLLLLPVNPGAVRAEFPDKPITVLVSFDPGSTTDLIVRTLAVGAEKALGQRLVFENRGGGGGTASLPILCF